MRRDNEILASARLTVAFLRESDHGERLGLRPSLETRLQFFTERIS